MGPDFGTFEAVREGWGRKNSLSTAGIAMRLLSPFPRDAVRERLKKAKVVLVVNQAHHMGRGHLTLDVVDALSDLSSPPKVVGAFAGMGGADVSEPTWERMLDQAKHALEGHPVPPYAVFHEGMTL
jgi:pyruvate/2-oxoacid:ferredoxin oxidoreductase alpha subunit